MQSSLSECGLLFLPLSKVITMVIVLVPASMSSSEHFSYENNSAYRCCFSIPKAQGQDSHHGVGLEHSLKA